MPDVKDVTGALKKNKGILIGGGVLIAGVIGYNLYKSRSTTSGAATTSTPEQLLNTGTSGETLTISGTDPGLGTTPAPGTPTTPITSSAPPAPGFGVQTFGGQQYIDIASLGTVNTPNSGYFNYEGYTAGGGAPIYGLIPGSTTLQNLSGTSYADLPSGTVLFTPLQDAINVGTTLEDFLSTGTLTGNPGGSEFISPTAGQPNFTPPADTLPGAPVNKTASSTNPGFGGIPVQSKGSGGSGYSSFASSSRPLTITPPAKLSVGANK